MAGRIIEKVTGISYERAIASLVFEPLGLAHSFFARDDIMTRALLRGPQPRPGQLAVTWRGCGGGPVATAPAAASRPRWPISCAGPRFISATAACEGGTACSLPS